MYTSKIITRIFTVVALTASLIIFNSCESNQKSTQNTIQSSSSASAKKTNSYQIADMINRAEDLSYDEFLKLEAKHERLKKQYNDDKNDFESLIKLSEIFIYEARVSGEHPYYYTAALATLDEIIKNQSKLKKDQYFTALFYKSTVELSQHHFNEALETAETALTLNDKNAGIYGVLVDAHVEIGNYEKAVEMCDKMMQIRPDLRSFSRISYLREIHGDLSGSKVAMQKAINAGAPYSEYKCWAITTLGKIYEAEGQLDSAKYCYEFAMTERENYPFGMAGIASVMAKKGENKKALEYYEKALNIIPEIGFTIEIAQLKMEENPSQNMDNTIAEIEEMFKEDMDSGHNMSLEYANFLCTFKQDYKSALNVALEEYKLRPSNIDVNKCLASIYYKLGDSAKAETHIDIALSTSKKDAELWCIAGLIKKDKGMIQASLDLDPYQSHDLMDEGKVMLMI